MRRVDREAVVLRPAADDQARDQPAAADHVDHGELFGDARRRVVERQGVADDGDLHALRLPGEDRAHQVRAGHRAVGVLMVLVDAHAVEAQARRPAPARRDSGCRARGRAPGRRASWAATSRPIRTSRRNRPAADPRASGERRRISLDGPPCPVGHRATKRGLSLSELARPWQEQPMSCLQHREATMGL